MERENRNNKKQNEAEISKRKWYSVIGFLISITLLSIAIFMSINQENNERLSRRIYLYKLRSFCRSV